MNLLTSKKTLIASAIVGEVIQAAWIICMVMMTIGRRIRRYRKLAKTNQ